MKNIFKKNQVIITALAVMIAVAGYLNYSGASINTEELAKETASSDLTTEDAADISDEDIFAQEQAGDIESTDVDLANAATDEAAEESSEGIPGEAVLTGTEASSLISQAKISREQIRSQNKDTLLGIINNSNVTEEQKQTAIESMIKLTEISEKESAAETLLSAKGFTDAVVTISEGSADVVLDMSDVTDAQRAQIEDIMKRKTGVAAENIVITPVSTQTSPGK